MAWVPWHYFDVDVFWHLFHRIYDVESLVRVGGIVSLATIVFIETGLLIGFFLPGDSLLVTAGLFAARGDLNVVTLVLTLSIAAIVGDTVGYNIGRRTGPRFFSRDNSLFFNKRHLITTKEFYDRHGPFTIVIARFVPIVRTFAPVVAGIGTMEYKRFISYNIIGGVGWVLSMILSGYFLGQIIPNIDKNIDKVIVLVIFLSLLPLIIKYLRERIKQR